MSVLQPGIAEGDWQGVEPLLLLPQSSTDLGSQWSIELAGGSGRAAEAAVPPLHAPLKRKAATTFLLEGAGGSGRRALKQDSVVLTWDGS